MFEQVDFTVFVLGALGLLVFYLYGYYPLLNETKKRLGLSNFRVFQRLTTGISFTRFTSYKFLGKSIWHMLILTVITLFIIGRVFLPIFNNNAESSDLFSIAVSLIIGTLMVCYLGYLGLFKAWSSRKDKIVQSLIRYNQWRDGADGEEQIKKTLKPPADYLVYYDFVLPSMKSNIDAIVICPNGVYILEIKNPNCQLKVTANQILYQKHGTYLPLPKDPLKQVKRNAVMMKQYIVQQLQIDMFVQPVLVIANKKNCIREREASDKVPVLFSDEIFPFIQKNKARYLSKFEIEKISRILLK